MNVFYWIIYSHMTVDNYRCILKIFPRLVDIPIVYSTNKTDLHDISEILLKVVINSITLTLMSTLTIPTLLQSTSDNSIVTLDNPYFVSTEV